MTINQLQQVLGVIAREIKFDIPLQQLRLLLLVAANPGITQTELGELLNLHQATISRNVKKMSTFLVEKDGGGFAHVGWGLLKTSQDTRFDSRRLACFLSDRGSEIIHTLNKTFQQMDSEFGRTTKASSSLEERSG